MNSPILHDKPLNLKVGWCVVPCTNLFDILKEEKMIITAIYDRYISMLQNLHTYRLETQNIRRSGKFMKKSRKYQPRDVLKIKFERLLAFVLLLTTTIILI